MSNKIIDQYWSRLRAGANLSNGVSFLSLNGRNPTLGTSFETLWGEGGIYQFPVAASQMTISSDDVNDNSSGTGGRLVLIDYLDVNYIRKQELISLNGTTPVTTVASIFRVNLVVVVQAGTTKTNEGIIYLGTGTVTAGKPANVFGSILIGVGVSQQAVVTIPANTRYHVADYVISSTKDKVLDLRFVFANIFGGGEEITDFTGVFNSGMSTFNFLGGGNLSKVDIRIDAKVDAGTTEASFYHIYYLTDE